MLIVRIIQLLILIIQDILKNLTQRVKSTCAALGSAIGKILNRPIAVIC